MNTFVKPNIIPYVENITSGIVYNASSKTKSRWFCNVFLDLDGWNLEAPNNRIITSDFASAMCTRIICHHPTRKPQSNAYI